MDSNGLETSSAPTATTFDVVIVGAGIVGLATAYALLQGPHPPRVAIMEKEQQVATHQSGRNSGVVHSGIYYRPGSLKATMAVEGAAALVQFCRQHGIELDVCGKLIVAHDEREVARLDALAERGPQNQIRVERLGPQGIRDLEPHAVGVAGLHVPSTGIVDFAAVSRALAQRCTDKGAQLFLGCRVITLDERPDSVDIETVNGHFRARCLVNCAGLYADLLARALLGRHPAVRILPFRGEFHALRPERAFLVRHLIYPVPDPDLPFLGVHASRGIDGRVRVGPNAVLAFGRESYSWSKWNLRESLHTVEFPGSWRLARKYWRTGVTEINGSLRRSALAHAVQHLLPEVRTEDLVPERAGVRAQAVDRNGRLLDDFLLHETPRAVHVLNAPSPAATASLPIGAEIARRVATHLD